MVKQAPSHCKVITSQTAAAEQRKVNCNY